MTRRPVLDVLTGAGKVSTREASDSVRHVELLGLLHRDAHDRTLTLTTPDGTMYRTMRPPGLAPLSHVATTAG